MKTTNTQKKAAKEITTRNGARHVQGATRCDARTSVKAAVERRDAVDRQVAEFERTFTPDYDW